MTFIEASNISKSYFAGSGPRHVLERVSLSVERGEFVTIVGFMGCGKSTLLNILAGVIRPDSGEIRLDGRRFEGLPAIARQEEPGVCGRTSIVFQNYSLLPWFSAFENVRLAVRAAQPDWSRADVRSQAERYLSLVGLGNAMHRRPNQLSGGMRQRVAIARAFATEPQLLFLDEPFGALDALTRANLQQELARLCSAGGGITTVMISNNLDEALLLSDRIIPMTRGPRATLGSPVTVDLPRPRRVEQLLRDEQAIRARTHVIEALTDHVRAANARSAHVRKPATGEATSLVAADSRGADL